MLSVKKNATTIIINDPVVNLNARGNVFACLYVSLTKNIIIVIHTDRHISRVLVVSVLPYAVTNLLFSRGVWLEVIAVIKINVITVIDSSYLIGVISVIINHIIIIDMLISIWWGMVFLACRFLLFALC